MPLTAHHVAPGFEAAAAVFEDAAADEEHAAQLRVDVGGEPVLDLAAGIDADALMTVYSVTKGLGALVMATLVDEGRLELDASVAGYWPEFAAAGKQDVTVRQLLSHQAGLPGPLGPLTTDDWLDDHAAAAALAGQRPFWRPGAGFGYHVVSMGTLLGELCFRVTGETVQRAYERRVRVPAGADAYLGLPDDLEPRVVELLPMVEPAGPDAAVPDGRGGPYGEQVLVDLDDLFLTRRARAFGHAAGGGVASARGLVAAYGWAVGWGRDRPGITAETLAEFAQTQVAGYDLVLDVPMRAHGVVFQKPTPDAPFGSFRAFGHDGYGGAMTIADPAGEIVLGYTVRRAPHPGGMDPAVVAVMDAVRGRVGVR